MENWQRGVLFLFACGCVVFTIWAVVSSSEDGETCGDWDSTNTCPDGKVISSTITCTSESPCSQDRCCVDDPLIASSSIDSGSGSGSGGTTIPSLDPVLSVTGESEMDEVTADQEQIERSYYLRDSDSSSVDHAFGNIVYGHNVHDRVYPERTIHSRDDGTFKKRPSTMPTGGACGNIPGCGVPSGKNICNHIGSGTNQQSPSENANENPASAESPDRKTADEFCGPGWEINPANRWVICQGDDAGTTDSHSNIKCDIGDSTKNDQFYCCKPESRVSRNHVEPTCSKGSDNLYDRGNGTTPQTGKTRGLMCAGSPQGFIIGNSQRVDGAHGEQHPAADAADRQDWAKSPCHWYLAPGNNCNNLNYVNAYACNMHYTVDGNVSGLGTAPTFIASHGDYKAYRCMSQDNVCHNKLGDPTKRIDQANWTDPPCPCGNRASSDENRAADKSCSTD